MDSQGIEIGRLEPMRAAALSVNSREPEGEAIGGLLDWAKARGISPDRVFGYDNCEPHPDHVYTAWIAVGPGVEGDERVNIVDYTGGRCASLTVSGAQNIHTSWQRLADWCPVYPGDVD